MFLTPSQQRLPSVFDYDEPPARKKKKISQSKMRLEPGGGEWKKLMKTVGGTECRDEREVTAASGQQMLWL